ncbi:potassium channel family protein [Mycoplasmopsis cricetuli]|uniref:potassium channel family protein n=1 Tax=Mycoplasmopsis cricetuli TaxID=171283 RepID=UPI000471678C|nr:TrkA family potassium uptake protein [Mycoplasmopsis cricetuli]
MKLKYKNDIAVIGTGRFGSAIIEQLITMNKNILIINKEEEPAKKFVDEVEQIVIADAAEIKALKGIGIERIETVVVAVPENIEIVAALQEVGVKNILARATNERHARVLKQIGVNIIIRPEHEAGIRAALIAGNPNFIQYSENLQELGNNFVIGTTQVQNIDFTEKKLKDINFNKYGVTIVLIKRGSHSIRPQGNTLIKQGDLLTIIGEVADVTDIFKVLNTISDDKKN